MNEINCIPGGPEWERARLGHVTASGVDSLITAAKLSLSSKRDEYMHGLIAERLLGERYETFAGSAATERGHELEPQAVAEYELLTGRAWRAAGFCRHSGLTWAGCSPDGLVDDTGGVECKCPMVPAIHMGYLVGDVLPRAYRLQVQFSLWVTGRSWWDFVSYYPGLPLFCVRVLPEPAVHDAFAAHVPAFVHDMCDLLAEVEARYGLVAALPSPWVPEEAA